MSDGPIVGYGALDNAEVSSRSFQTAMMFTSPGAPSEPEDSGAVSANLAPLPSGWSSVVYAPKSTAFPPRGPSSVT